MTTLRKVLPLILLCAALSGLPLAAQTQDCSFTYTFTGDSTQTAVSNLSGNTPCVNWRITLSTDAAPPASGSLSSTVTFQTSPDNTVWTAIPNTVCSSTVQPPCVLQGANPIVGTQGMLYVASYGTFVRVVITGSSGTGHGTIRGYGVKGASANAGAGSGGGGSGTVTSVGFTGGIVTVNTPTTTPALIIAGTSGGIPYFTSASTWATSAVLGLNRVVLGGGPGGAPTVTAADTTPTHALFATAGAPAFRAIVLSDLPALPGAVACPENPISMTATNTYTCTDNLGVATGKFLWCQDPNSTPVNAAVQVSWAGATANTFTWVAATTETVNCYASLGGGGSGGGGSGTVTNVATAGPITGGPITASGTIGLDTTLVAQKFLGTVAPGSVATNLPGDLFTDTTAHNEYVCNAPSGTVTPACTSVTAAGWLLVNGGGGGYAITTGPTNTFLGVDAGNGSTTGTYNTFSGVNAGFGITSGNANTFSGGFAGQSNTSGNANTFYGYNAGYGNVSGSNNTFTGYQAGLHSTGDNNTFTGYQAGQNYNTGNYNVFTGSYAGHENTSGSNNTFSGYYAGLQNTSGSNDTFSGYYAGANNSSGSNNTFFGYYAGENITSSSNNTFSGYQAGSYISGGGNNTTGSSETVLGAQAYPLADGDTDEIVIGASAVGAGSHTVVIGANTVTDLYFGSSTPAATIHQRGYQLTGFYNASTSALPACAAGTVLLRAGVTDATVATPGTTYAGGGTFTIAVQCTYNSVGTAYSWIID